MPDHDRAISERFRQQCEAARAQLRREMEARGLHPKDGWTIHESTRASGNGTAIVFRPMHLRERVPDDLECWVQIDEDSQSIEAECEPRAQHGNLSR